MRELHQAEARLALAVPEAADKARAITADLVVASTGEAARDTPKLDEDLAVLVKLVY